MNFNESTSARPIGVPTGPREDYKPDPHVFRRGTSQTGVSQTTSPAAACKTAVSALQAGTYTDRIMAAVQAGHSTTSTITSATKISRDSVIKTLSYLIKQKRIEDWFPLPGTPEGDRYVGLADGGLGLADGSLGLADNENLTNIRPQNLEAETPGATDNMEKDTGCTQHGCTQQDCSPEASPLAAFETIVQEWKEIGAEVSAIQSLTSAVQHRLETAMTAFPVLYDAIASAEQAKKSQAVLTSITDALRSLNVSI